jgi:hypothetical protein
VTGISVDFAEMFVVSGKGFYEMVSEEVDSFSMS